MEGERYQASSGGRRRYISSAAYLDWLKSTCVFDKFGTFASSTNPLVANHFIIIIFGMSIKSTTEGRKRRTSKKRSLMICVELSLSSLKERKKGSGCKKHPWLGINVKSHAEGFISMNRLKLYSLPHWLYIDFHFSAFFWELFSFVRNAVSYNVNWQHFSQKRRKENEIKSGTVKNVLKEKLVSFFQCDVLWVRLHVVSRNWSGCWVTTRRLGIVKYGCWWLTCYTASL